MNMRINHIGICSLLLVFGAGAAWAEVSAFDATVTAEVREYQDGAQVNSDQAFEDLDETSGVLPLSVETQLLRNDAVEGQANAGGYALAQFSDPRLSETPDPQEFALDVIAFSRLTGISYIGNSTATESRTVVFTADEIGAVDGTELQARSYFFLDGYLLLWGDAGQADLSASQVSLQLSVARQQGDAEAEEVLTAGLSLVGQTDGAASLAAEGLLETDNVVLLDLTGQVEGLGPIFLVIVPELSLSYAYNAQVGRTFTLTAEIEGDLETAPLTGGAVQVGVPLSDIVEVVNDATGEDIGDELLSVIELALSSAPEPAKALEAPDDPGVRVVDGFRLAPASCGLLGGGWLVASLGWLGLIGYHCVRRVR